MGDDAMSLFDPPGRYPRMVAYEVHTPVYEGPFDLLLHLITKEQVDLYDVSISRIVDAYLSELDRMREASENGLDLDVATEFLLIAATLVELKSRRLLPVPEGIDLDEELALWEERDFLLARLLECKTFKDAAVALQQIAEEASLSLPRTAGLEDQFLSLAPDLLVNATPEKIRQAYLRATEPKPVPHVDLEHVAPIRASVQDAVEVLVKELPSMGVTSFRQITAGIHERLEVIVRFLAVLELFKQGFVEIDQAGNFGELKIWWVDEGAIDPGAVQVEAYDG